MASKSQRKNLILGLLRGRTSESALSVLELTKLLVDKNIDVTDRTVRRDMLELSSEFGLASTEDFPERYFLTADYHIKHQILFSDVELQVLLIALNNLKHTSDKFFESVAAGIEGHILKNLPTDALKVLQTESKKYFFDMSLAGKPKSSAEKNFGLILEALRTNKCFTCKNISPYKSRKLQERLRSFAPYRFVLTAGVPYLLVQDLDDKQIKRLRVNRIESVKLLERDVDHSLKVNWEKYTTQSLGGFGGEAQELHRVIINCDETMANYFIEKTIHASQKVQQLDEGSFRLQFDVPLSHDFVRLVASFLPHIYDIANPTLGAMIIQSFGPALRRLKVAA